MSIDDTCEVCDETPGQCKAHLFALCDNRTMAGYIQHLVATALEEKKTD